MPTANGSAIHTSRGRNQAYTFIDQVRVLVAEMKCVERLPRALLLCSVPLVRTCTALELFRAEIIARKCTARICIVRTYPERLLVSADEGSRNSTMACGGGGAEPAVNLIFFLLLSISSQFSCHYILLCIYMYLRFPSLSISFSHSLHMSMYSRLR